MKTTYKASSDIALVKYWGKKNEQLRLPENGSVSIVLDGLDTVTTVEFDEDLKTDEVTIAGGGNEREVGRVVRHLDRIRKMAEDERKARVVSVNTFPKGTGLSSSGSGFAALTCAATAALGMDLTTKELSILARQGSGTACRCVVGGLVEWKDGNSSDSSYSEQLQPADYWDLRDVVVVVDEGMKRVSSSEGHRTAQSSIVYEERQRRIGQKITDVKKAIEKKDFTALGELVEREALEFHSVLLTSNPPLMAWYPGTVEVMQTVERMRREGIEAYYTINTGFNVHVLTLPADVEKVEKQLDELTLVKKTLVVGVGGAPELMSKHLF